MAAEESSQDVLERVFFWTMASGVGFVAAGAVISLILTAYP